MLLALINEYQWNPLQRLKRTWRSDKLRSGPWPSITSLRRLSHPNPKHWKYTKLDLTIVQPLKQVRRGFIRPADPAYRSLLSHPEMNLDSSRSHAVFVITMTKEHPEDSTHTRAVLNLVDLAGSEKVGKSGSEGIALDEARKINLSLTSLCKVIHALTENQRVSDIFVSPGNTPVQSSLLVDRTSTPTSPFRFLRS